MPTNFKLYCLWLPLFVILLGGLAITFLFPESLPEGQGQIMREASLSNDFVIIFDPGGWGNATLDQSKDFAPVLEGIRQTLVQLGYNPVIFVYRRTPPGFSGYLSDIKESTTGYRQVSQVQARDIEDLSQSAPSKPVLLVGFSNGGGFAGKTFSRIPVQYRVKAIVAGVPFWYRTFPSATSLVLNNQGKDTLACQDIKEMTIAIIKAPFRWIWAKITGQNLSLALAFEFPGHAYSWSSNEVRTPIMKFLDDSFSK